MRLPVLVLAPFTLAACVSTDAVIVAIVDADGTVLRTVELPDMSPFVVAVQP